MIAGAAAVRPRPGGAAGQMLGFTVTIPSFPGIGDAWLVGALFLAHIAIAEFSVGAITLAAAMEGYALRSGSAYARRYARAAANSYYLVFSLGATFAIFAVVAHGRASSAMASAP